MNKISMMELRREPGEYFYRRCFKGGESFTITYMGKSIAQIIPIDSIIDSKGKITGERPVTFKNSKLR